MKCARVSKETETVAGRGWSKIVLLDEGSRQRVIKGGCRKREGEGVRGRGRASQAWKSVRSEERSLSI